MMNTAEREPARSGQLILEYIPGDGGYFAVIVGRPGIMSQGETPRDALRSVLEAMFEAEDARTIVHKSPEGASGVTPCCGVTPFELPQLERLTLDDERVTCGVERRD